MIKALLIVLVLSVGVLEAHATIIARKHRIRTVCASADEGQTLSVQCPNGYALATHDPQATQAKHSRTPDASKPGELVDSSGNPAGVLHMLDYFTTGSLHDSSCKANNFLKIDSDFNSDIDNPIRFDCHVPCTTEYYKCIGKNSCSFTVSASNCESGSACSSTARSASVQQCTKIHTKCTGTRRLIARFYCIRNSTYDATAPLNAGAWVMDGNTGAEVDWQSSRKCVGFRFGGFRDFESGISKYQFAVGTTPGGAQTLAWKDIPSAVYSGGNLVSDSYAHVECPFNSTELVVGSKYYVSVRAFNNNDNSSMRWSDGFTVNAEFASPTGTALVSGGSAVQLMDTLTEYNVRIVAQNVSGTMTPIFQIARAANSSHVISMDTLQRGRHFVFHVDPTMPSGVSATTYTENGIGTQPFYLTTSSTGGGAGGDKCKGDLSVSGGNPTKEVYYTGGDREGWWPYDLHFKPSASTPDTIYFGDCNHANRGGSLRIGDGRY